jgi:hypothetical protein
MPELRQRIIQSRIVVPVVVLPESESGRLDMVEGKALFDTGASVSGISKTIASRLGLVGRGKKPIVGVRGMEQVERYLFRMGFVIGNEQSLSDGAPPYVLDGDVFGIEFAETENFDVLIGMDIIRTGDLSLSHHGEFRFVFQ